MRKASAMVEASTARRVAPGAIVLLSMFSSSPRAATGSEGERYMTGASPSKAEALAREPPDVVRQADDEQEGDQGEAHEPGPFHDIERDRAAAHLLRQRPEDVPAVERQEREEVDDPQRERDDGQHVER